MVNLLELQSDPAAFRSALLIDTDAGPARFADRMDAWQATDFAALDAGWKRTVVGSSHVAQRQRGWLERPRGHSKSADLGIMSAWALFASRRPLSGIAAAGDQDQARLLRDAVGKLLLHNPWLARVLEVQAYRVVNVHTGSVLEIITSDAPTSYGLTPDFIIADEVTHWRKRDLWDSLLSSAAKRSTCILVVITNAGIHDDWQWSTREAVRVDPDWFFSRLEGPCASWIAPSLLAEQARLLPSIAFRRLWMNQWTSGGGDALTEADIAAAFRSDLRRQREAIPGFEYVAGLDLGVSRDSSALCVLGVRRSHQGHGTIRLALTQVWRPTPGKRVDLQEVEDAIADVHARFELKQCNYDPWNAAHLASRLQAGGLSLYSHNLGRHHTTSRVPMNETTPTPKNLQAMATVLIEAFNDHRVELFPEPDLHRDLRRLRVEEKSYGFRLTTPRDATGHGDLGTAFTLALLAASEIASKRKPIVGCGWSISEEGFSGPFAHALASFKREQKRFEEEQKAGRIGDDRLEDWRRDMELLGRTK